MKDKGIFEIVVVGRGGQGAKTAAEFIAEAALDKGKNIQAFPEYGPERAGAPVKSYVRISNKPIKTYAPVVNPDVVIVIDPTLLNTDVKEGLTKKGIFIANTNKDKTYVKQKIKFEGKIHTVDATKISIEAVGKNLPNTPMIGALIKTTDIISLESINKKVEEKFLDKLGKEKTKATIEAIKKAYDEVR